MNRLIGAPTLDDVLVALGECVQKNEEMGKKSLVFCEDRLTLLCERAILERLEGSFLTEVTTFARFLSDGRKVLSKQGSVVVVSGILKSEQVNLTCFRKNSAQLVYETIAQLCASKVSPEMLLSACNEVDGTLKRKLSDLALVYGKYLEFLEKTKRLDESGYLALLPEKLASAELYDTEVFFVAFPSFTRQAQDGVRSALKYADGVTAILTAGKNDFYTNESAKIMHRLMDECGEPEVRFLRSSLSGDSLALSSALFSATPVEKTKAENITTFVAEDEESELGIVASLIEKELLVGKRLKDITVLVPSEDRFPLVEKVFSSYRIPFFADRKRSLSSHPFAKFILACFSASWDGALPATVDEIASSVYFGEGDEYRNYLLRYGAYRGGVEREIKTGEPVKDFDRDALVMAREKMLAILSHIPRKGRGEDFVHAVRALKEEVKAEEVTTSLAKNLLPSDAEFLELAPFDSLLEEMLAVSGEQTYTASDFALLLSSGMESTKVSLIPQYNDAVFVGDCTESRFARCPVLFATGLSESLPRSSQDTAVITDGEIGLLSDIKVEIEPAIAKVNARMKEHLALNLCAFSEKLYLSYSTSEKGAEARSGEVLKNVSDYFETAPMPELFAYENSRIRPALLRLSLASHDDPTAYATIRLALERSGKTVAKEVGTGEKANVTSGEKLFFSKGTVSPSLLERYFACPYSGFATYGLKLAERKEASSIHTDAGNFVHAVLEKIALELNDLSDEGTCSARATAYAEELLSSRLYSHLSDTASGTYTGKRLVEEARASTLAMFRQLKGSSYRIKSAEEWVKLPELALSGKTDRIDESDDYVRIIDYKTGSYEADPTTYYMGKKLQLQLYLKATSEGKIPAGAFYFPASEKYTKPDEKKFRMEGFYNSDEDALSRLDDNLDEKGKSEYFEGSALSGEDFKDFIDYSVLVSKVAEGEIKSGNVKPSPAEGACSYCKLRGMCGYDGRERKLPTVNAKSIVETVKKAKEESNGDGKDGK